MLINKAQNCQNNSSEFRVLEFEDFENHFRIKWCYKLIKLHKAPLIYWVPHGLLRVFNISYTKMSFKILNFSPVPTLSLFVFKLQFLVEGLTILF
jgi:hypothetical protein